MLCGKSSAGSAGRSGPVRDLDVMIDHLRVEAATLDGADVDAAAGLVAGLEVERQHARDTLLASMRSARYTDLLDRVAAACDPPLAGDDTELLDIWRSEHTRLRKAIGRLGDDPEDDALHAVRIKVKRARYAAELSGLDRYVRRAKGLQDVLGELQDAVTAEHQLREVGARSPAVTIAAGRLVERERRRRALARDNWGAAWKSLSRVGREVA